MPGGGPTGSSGTGTGSIANVYTPMNQPAADVQYNNILQSMIGAGGGIAQEFYPYVQNLADYAVAQPWLPTAMQGARTAANYGAQIAPQDISGANKLFGAAGVPLQYQQQALSQGFDPLYSRIVSQAANNPYYAGALGGARQAAGIGGAGAGQLASGAGGILQTAFDPQSQLYNRMRGEALDRQNVINAMSGVASTPYAAGVTGDALSNFDINWQNQQLGRQQAGLGAAASAYPTATNLAASSAALPSNVFTQNLAQQLAALQGRGQGAAQGVSAADALLGAGGAGLTTAGGLGNLGIGTIGSSAAAPYNLQAGANTNTLNQLAQAFDLGNQQFVLPQQTLNDLQSYLRLGQAASGLSGSLGGLGQQQALQQALGIGSGIAGLNSLLGGGTGTGGLFGGGGLLGGLGGSGGILGGLFGGGAAAADPLSLAFDAVFPVI